MMSTRNAQTTTPVTISADSTPPPDWDGFVRSAPGGTFCHLGAWGPIMRDVMGHDVLFACARDDEGKLAGVVPVVEVRSALFGHYLVSMPFLNYGGPVGARDAQLALMEWATSQARERGAGLLEMRWREEALRTREDPPLADGFELTDRKITVILDLPDDPETLFTSGLKAKVRSQVRRPMKEGYEARIGHDQVDAFYQVFERNMRDLGTPVLPASLFRALPEGFGDDVTFVVVYDGDRPIAGGCGFHFEGEFELTWASSLREYNRTAPNMLLYWRLMEHAIQRGDGSFNFGRCTPGGGTHRFKSQWGGGDVPLPWAAWSPTGKVATPNPDQSKYRLATNVWRRLPVAVTSVLGPPLARRIP